MSSPQAPSPAPAHPEGAQLRSVAGRLNALQALDARDLRLNELSQELTNMLFILFRSAGLYDLDNQALDQAYEGMLKAVGGYIELTRVAPALRVIEGNIFINRRQVKLDFSTFQNVRALVKIFTFLDVNELSFDPQLTREDLVVLLRAFVRIARDRQGSIRDEVLPHVRVRKLKIGKVHKLLLSEGHAEQVCSWYAIALSDTQAFYLDAAEGRLPPFSMLKRLAQTLVNLPSACLPLLSCVHLIAPQEARGSLTQQSVEAAAISVVLGQALALDSGATSTLASAAFQLYQGWTLIEEGVQVGDPQGGGRVLELLSEHGRSGALPELRRHIARKILELGGVNESVIERAVMIYEAQSSLEARGARGAALLPSRAKSKGELYAGGLDHGLLTELVVGAHLYAHLRATHGPAEAMARLRRSALSPLSLKAFELAFGQHPVGAPVTLSDGQLGLVLQLKEGEPCLVLRVKRSEGRLEAGEVLTLHSTSPIQIQAEGEIEDALIAPLIFSHRGP